MGRVLVEHPDRREAEAYASALWAAGHVAAICSGPSAPGSSCPLVRGHDCPLAADADAVVSALDGEVVRALRRYVARTPVVVDRGAGPKAVAATVSAALAEFSPGSAERAG